MTDRLTPKQVANDLRREAAHIDSTARILRVLADELDPPDIPEVSRSSHYSG